MSVGQYQWYHFGVGTPPILVDFIGDWDVHWGYGMPHDCPLEDGTHLDCPLFSN